MKLLNRLLLITTAVVASIGLYAVELTPDTGVGDEIGTRRLKKIKCLQVGQLLVCGNEQVNGNLTVNGALTVGGSSVSASSSSSTGSGALAYGSFYSNTATTALSAITLTTGNTSDPAAFTPFSNGTGTGVTVANAGTYIVWYHVLLNSDSDTLTLQTAAGVVAGSNVNNDLNNDNTWGDGFAVVTVTSDGGFIIIAANDTTGTPNPPTNQTILMTLLRVK